MTIQSLSTVCMQKKRTKETVIHASLRVCVCCSVCIGQVERGLQDDIGEHKKVVQNISALAEACINNEVFSSPNNGTS